MTVPRRRSTDIPPDRDAWQHSRWVADGCDHNNPACRCETPFWLRQPTAVELKRYKEPGKMPGGGGGGGEL